MQKRQKTIRIRSVTVFFVMRQLVKKPKVAKLQKRTAMVSSTSAKSVRKIRILHCLDANHSNCTYWSFCKSPNVTLCYLDASHSNCIKWEIKVRKFHIYFGCNFMNWLKRSKVRIRTKPKPNNFASTNYYFVAIANNSWTL